MPYNGSGTYEPLPPPDFPAVTGTTIKASEYNNQIDDMATALSSVVTSDGQSEVTANLPMYGYRFTNVGDAVDPGDLLTKRQLAATSGPTVGAGLVAFLSSVVYVAGTVGYELKQFVTSGGSALIGFIAALGGARTRTVQEKLREVGVSLCDFSTIVADGSDQTSAIVTWLGTLDPAIEGVVRAPYNCRFNNATVVAALPSKLTLIDESQVNSWNTAGYQARTMGITDNSGAATTDQTWKISSSHNANMIIDNRGTAGTTSATRGIAAILFGRGQYTIGQPGIRQMGRLEFGEIAGTSKWSVVIRRYQPWLAQASNYWAPTQAYAAGAYIVSSPLEYIYMTVAGGTTGAVAPQHTSGSAVDGTVTWVFVSSQTDILCWGVNENGEMGLNASPQSGVLAHMKASQDSGGTAVVIMEAVKASNRAELRLLPTNAGSAAITAIPRLYALDDGTLRFRNSTLTQSLVVMSDTTGFNLGVYGHTESTAVNNSTTPSVLNCGLLIIANTGATLITDFLNSTTTQEVTLFFQNGNTTLVNGANLVLRGGINVVPVLNQIVVIKKYTGSGAWIEKSRNF